MDIKVLNRENRLLNWIALIIWMGMIFYLSSIPNLKISEGLEDLILRKIAHFVEFFILALLWFKALRVTKKNLSKLNIIFLSCCFSIIYAILDEFHQSFVPTRCASIIDVFIDSLGVLFFSLIAIRNKISKII